MSIYKQRRGSRRKTGTWCYWAAIKSSHGFNS